MKFVTLCAALVLAGGCSTVKTAGPGLEACATSDVQQLLPSAEQAITHAIDSTTIVGSSSADIETNALKQLEQAMATVAQQAANSAPQLAECALDAVEAAAAGQPGDATSPPIAPSDSVIVRRISAYRLKRAQLAFAPHGGGGK